MWDRLNTEQDSEETSFFEADANRASIFDEPPEAARTVFERFRMRSSKASVATFANNELAERAYLQSEEFDDLAMPMSIRRDAGAGEISKLFTFNEESQSAASLKLADSFDNRRVSHFGNRASVNQTIYEEEGKSKPAQEPKESSARPSLDNTDRREASLSSQLSALVIP